MSNIVFAYEEDDDFSEGMDTREVHDLQYDDWLMPSGEPLDRIARFLFEEVEKAFPRPKKQRRDATQRRYDMVSNIVANLALLACHYHLSGRKLMVSASNLKATRYDRPAFSKKAFMEVISALEDLKFLNRERGKRGGARTTIEPGDALRLLLPQAGTSLPLVRLPGAETIILRADAGRNKPKVPIDYCDTPETRQLRDEMATINKVLNAVIITLDEQVQPPVHLSRIFQIDHEEAPREFNNHGRLYGGFWEYLPKSERHLIRIDGHQVAEVDFAGMFVHLAYAEAGLPPMADDPYLGIEGMPRDAAKIAMSALLCKRGPMRRMPSKLRELLDANWTGRLVAEALADRHPGIAHLMGHGVGLKLMHTESRIMVSALLSLIGQGIPALPIHDALLVAQDKAEHCAEAMRAASSEVLGRELEVRRKDNFPPMPYLCLSSQLET